MSEKQLKRIRTIYSIVVMLVLILNTVNFQWRGETLINAPWVLDIPLLLPLKQTISNIFSGSITIDLLFTYLYSILLFIIVIDIPFGVYNFIRKLLGGARL